MPMKAGMTLNEADGMVLEADYNNLYVFKNNEEVTAPLDTSLVAWNGVARLWYLPSSLA